MQQSHGLFAIAKLLVHILVLCIHDDINLLVHLQSFGDDTSVMGRHACYSHGFHTVLSSFLLLIKCTHMYVYIFFVFIRWTRGKSWSKLARTSAVVHVSH